MSARVRYHLRYQIAPGRSVGEIANDLVAFCQTHGVEEVVLFYGAEERNTGLLSREEEDRWFDAMEEAHAILTQAGVEVSLNPWMTVLHTSRGRGFPEGWTFAPTISPEGEASTATASFADREWRRYISEQYGRFAELGFRVLWVEDDFRYHNHAPLAWGGGFEEPILERFARKAGRAVTRDEVVNAILAPGKPHPWRAMWMENWREIQLEVATLLARAVAERSPRESQLGLMSSSMEAHGIEGRRWKELFDALSIEGRVVHRPHFASYSDAVVKSALPWSIMMLDLQRSLRPPETEVAPEIENFPFTQWNKADAQTWCEMALAMVYGSDALLLDLFPFTGNRASDEPEVGRLLDRSRPALQWVAERFRADDRAVGVGYLWRADAQEHVQLEAGAGMGDLDASPGGPARVFPGYGIPIAAGEREVNALFGSLAWAVPDEDLERLLGKGLVLDGRAAEILCHRGFMDDIGVCFLHRASREDSLYAMEQAASPQSGIPDHVFLNCNIIPSMSVFELLDGAVEWTSVLSPSEERLFPATVAFENARGGRVFTITAPEPGRLPQGNYRQMLLRRAVAFVAAGAAKFPTVTGAPHLLPIVLDSDNCRRIAVVNAGVDPAVAVVHLPERPGQVRATTLLPMQAPVEVRAVVEEEDAGAVVRTSELVSHLGVLVVELW